MGGRKLWAGGGERCIINGIFLLKSALSDIGVGGTCLRQVAPECREEAKATLRKGGVSQGYPRYSYFHSGVFVQVLARDAAGRGGLSYRSPCAWSPEASDRLLIFGGTLVLGVSYLLFLALGVFS